MKTLSYQYTAIKSWFETHPFQRRLISILALWSISALLLFPTLPYPREIVFDESYMIPRAQKYINGIFFQESHPPLGRLLIALGQHLMHPEEKSNEFVNTDKIRVSWPDDKDIAGYRLFPAIFGTINPLLAFAIILIVTSSEGLALFSAFALALDNALLTQSHFGLSDSILLACCLLFILCMVWLLSRNEKPGRAEKWMWVLTGLAAGAAFMVKFTGLFGGLLLPIYLYRLFSKGYKREIISFMLVSGLAFLLVVLSVWQLHFSLLTSFTPNDDFKLSELHQQILEGTYNPNPAYRLWIEISDSYAYMISYHETVPALDLSKPDEIGSPWYQWPFGGRAMPYRWNIQSDFVQFIYLIGNPITWLLSLFGVVSATAVVVAHLLFGFMKDSPKRFWIFTFGLLYWFYMITMMQITRVMYLYHYLPPMVIGIILFALVFSEISTLSIKTKRNFLFAGVALIIMAFLVYSPFLYYQPLTVEQFQQRSIWPAWDLRCQYCKQDQ